MKNFNEWNLAFDYQTETMFDRKQAKRTGDVYRFDVDVISAQTVILLDTARWIYFGSQNSLEKAEKFIKENMDKYKESFGDDVAIRIIDQEEQKIVKVFGSMPNFKPTSSDAFFYIWQNLDSIPIHIQKDGKWRSYYLSELSCDEAREAIIKFLDEGKWPCRVIKE
jgi:hypothetical protein